MPTKKKPDQSQAPILEAIQRYHERDVLPFTTPGHKKGRGILEADRVALGPDTFRNDIPVQNGVDDRRESQGVQQQAEELAAAAIGADQVYFSTNGSSLSAHVAIISVANPGDKILIARNLHKSLVAALVMADVIPVFLQPALDEELDVEYGITPEHLEDMLTRHPETKGVFVVSPDYFGVTADVKSLAQVCHRHNVPLIVDEAWGAHFPYHPELPPSALECGADMSFNSVHKTMNGLGMASTVNLKGDRIDADRFTLCFDLFESTSASSLILASTDAARRQMALHGEELWGQALKLARHARRELADLPGLRVVGKEVLRQPGAFALDETKLTVDVRGLNLNGYLAADWIEQHHNITLELADHHHLMALISVADTDETVDRLIAAIKDLHAWARKTKPKALVPLPPLRDIGSELVMTPTKAFFNRTRKVPIAKAAGQICAEMVSPYPPGIPRLVPGERITAEIIDYLQKGRDAGMLAVDPSDETLRTLRVVDLGDQ